jgi:hypothetical protein
MAISPFRYRCFASGAENCLLDSVP